MPAAPGNHKRSPIQSRPKAALFSAFQWVLVFPTWHCWMSGAYTQVKLHKLSNKLSKKDFVQKLIKLEILTEGK